MRINSKIGKHIRKYSEVKQMRVSEKAFDKNYGSNQLFGVDLHDFTQKESSNSFVELATEFGISVGDVMKLKKQMERN
ncbi:MAG: hypothetical protein K0R71_16 [Bacillales bacterium]|jgi:hypothetical protein|nr:hypothetical protein [Bacillales bacterium]